MRFAVATAFAALVGLAVASPTPSNSGNSVRGNTGNGQKIAPKVFVFSMYDSEDVWTDRIALTQNVTVPGLSPLFPNVHCNAAGEICQLITGEAEINAACTVTALLFSNLFDFTSTYFLIAGVAGVNPHMGTSASVLLARYAVQVALANEVDAREMPSNWTTGYWLQGTSEPGTMDDVEIYGTEVFELNTNLREKVRPWLDGITLNDTTQAQEYRATFGYSPASDPPAVFYGDVSTSDVYFLGADLDNAFANITSLWTNGTGQYAMTAQEDNATFEAMIRAHLAGLMDFSRVILLRAASDFDRSPPNAAEVPAFLASHGGYPPSLENLFIAGNPIVQGIISNWSSFKGGVAPQDGWLHNADVNHTLELKKAAAKKRSMSRRGALGLARR
ncbi:uncharacterized protein EHS24_002807 [Apiotrichum porosum]|uniref:Purine nucleoside permease n=1 Tax=Apiotrichum porosum TaxID=105984 RepID=A0A427XFR9_9TREE|nr:uncharacterized protein EHS24_002807 [Apiotrichum porosum]RSH77749.1 hypothetical protein EHS24_002807 [Apiotrichum porosum]